MSTYSIQYLEQLSGIKAHTIRIWEQRYQLLQPQRNTSNVRSYSDDDLKKILVFSTLLNAGYKIGDLAQLTTAELNDRVNELNKSVIDDEKLDFANINALTAAAMTYDEESFEKIFKRIVTRHGIEYVYLYILHPFLVRIGSLWNIDQIIPTQEHFISNLIRQKLFSAINDCKIQSGNETWILFLPEQEDHEIGLLFSNYLLRYYGKKTIYLGQKVPMENLHHVIKTVNPTGILSFAVTQNTTEQNQNFIKDLNSINSKITKVICSTPSHFIGIDLSQITNINSAAEYIQWVKKIK